MFKLKRVTKQFGSVQAVVDVDLNTPSGKTTVLIGPSGCGKSTLLRLMIGLIAADKGVVSFEGDDVTTSNSMMLRRKMGFVIQDGGLFPHLTASQNTTLLATYLGWDKNRIAARLEELADLTHFPKSGLRRYPAELSGGQCQRVSLIRALMLNPDVLLMDEPLGALDPMIRRKLQEDLRSIFKDLGKTVVMVTHDLGEAAYFADEIILMKDGEIIQKGGVSQLLDAPANGFVTEFVNAQRSLLSST